MPGKKGKQIEEVEVANIAHFLALGHGGLDCLMSVMD